MVVALRVSSQVDRQLAKSKTACTEEEFFRIRREVGHAMGRLFDGIIRPIFEEHPDLKPVSLGGTYEWPTQEEKNAWKAQQP